jgi:hypothetical protein
MDMSASPRRLRQLGGAVAVVLTIDGHSRRDEFIDAVEDVGGQGDVVAGSWETSCSLVRGPMIVDVTPGWLTTKAMASSLRQRPDSQPPASGLYVRMPIPYRCVAGGHPPRARGRGSSTAGGYIPAA